MMTAKGSRLLQKSAVVRNSFPFRRGRGQDLEVGEIGGGLFYRFDISNEMEEGVEGTVKREL